MNKGTNTKKGFTLVELLIVIGILGILAAAVVVVLNPAELLKQARDAQRIQDLGSINSSLALYLTGSSSPDLNDAQAASECGDDDDVATDGDGYVAVDPTTVSFTNRSLVNEGTDATQEIDGDGWLPVDLSTLTGGSPIAKYPVDPSNTGDLVYRYACNQADLTWELNGKLESAKYLTDLNLDGLDGGDSATFYEIGTEPGFDL